MASKKTKKRREKKSRLSDKDIIKLIKKLRPKNQQIVRVNVGDKADKKKGSTSAFQPNIVPVLSYAAPFQTQQLPPPPAPPLPPPLPMSQQAQLQPLISPPPPPLRREPSLLLTDTEAESPVKVRKTRTSRKALETAEQGYSVQPARESRFKAPKGYTGSSLSASSSQPSYFQAPTENDRFVSVVSFEDPSTDQAGVIAQPLSSDEWVGSPQGLVEAEPMSGSAAAASEEPTPTELPPSTESTTVQKIKEISQISNAFGDEPQVEATAAVDEFLFNPTYEANYLNNLVRDAPETALGLMKNEIVEKLKGGFTGVPKEYLTKTGRLKTKIPVKEMYNLYIGL
jgi:hypothetical protein